MSDTAEIHARLLAHARNYDPSLRRSVLGPYRDVLLLWRAKEMSYEDIAAAFAQNGVKISAAGVGFFCRRNLPKSEIERARRELRDGSVRGGAAAPAPMGGTPVPVVRPPGPRIARDNY